MELQAELWSTSRSGARAGRGFRYQDVVAALVALTLWADGEASARVVPEGYDDISVERPTGTLFMQVKSRRESAGDFPKGQLRRDLQSVAVAWARRRDAGLSPTTLLVLERPVVSVPAPEWEGHYLSLPADVSTEMAGALKSVDLEDDAGRGRFTDSISVAVCPDPRTRAISIVAGARAVPESLAEIIVSAVCTQVGHASDANADRNAGDRASVDVAAIDLLVERTISAVDLQQLDEARALGICETIDWERPADRSDLRRGAHVGPAHVAAGQLVPRPELTQQVIDDARSRRLAVVAGPSGSGKSALAYAAVFETRRSFRWQQVLSLTPAGSTGRDAVALLVARIESLQPSPYAPVGILMDDAGRHDPDLLDRLLRRLADLPNVITLVSIREEDRFPVGLLSVVTTITPMLDDRFAEQLWSDYRADGFTAWAGWREPAERANGLLLEYIALLTDGEDLDTVVGAQVQARERDPNRHLELEILRLASCANQYGVAVPADAIRTALGADPGSFTAASRRLIAEHLVVEDSSGLLRPLHEIRSAALARAAHPFGQGATLEHLVGLVPGAELSRFLRRAFEGGADPSAMTQAAAVRIGHERALPTLVAVASAAHADGLRRRADDWKRLLDECGVEAGNAVTAFMMSRTSPSPEALKSLVPEVADAVERLRSVPTDPDLRPLWEAIGTDAVKELLAAAIADGTASELLLQAIVVLRGINLSALEPTADAVGERLQKWPLDLASDMTEALRRAAPELARRAVTVAGGERALLRRIVIETPWLVSLERRDDGVDGKWIFIDEHVQADQNGPVVDVCRLALALAPSAAIARVSAVDVLGHLVMLGDRPLVEKAIRREKLPHALEVSDNRAKARALGRKYGAGTLTAKLAIEAEALRAVIDLLPEITLAHLSEQPLSRTNVRRFERVAKLLSKMNAPAYEEYSDDIPGALGDYPVESAAVIVVHSLLHRVIPDLARKIVTERQPARAAFTLDSIIAKVRTLIEADAYRYLPDPPDCAQLLDCLSHLRTVASASGTASHTICMSMRAAAGRQSGTGRVAAAAGAATDHSPVALQHEAERVQGALAQQGFTVTVSPSPTGSTMRQWPCGDLAIAVEGDGVLAFQGVASALVDAVRGIAKKSGRHIWIGLHRASGYVPASILLVTSHGVYELEDHEPPSAFAGSIAATPISRPYRALIQQARRLSSIVAIIAIRGTSSIPDDEGRALEQSWESLATISEQINEAISTGTGTEYASTLIEILAHIRATLAEDLMAAEASTAEGRCGWEQIASLRGPHLFYTGGDDAMNIDAAAIFGMMNVSAEVEDDFEGADILLQRLQEETSTSSASLSSGAS